MLVELGFSSIKDLLDVLVVPLSVAVLVTLWPNLAARRRRANFEDLICRELLEAAPHGWSPGASTPPWPEYLTRRFTHEDVIAHPSGNTEFVLSLDPELSYHLSQMCIELEKSKSESQRGQEPSEQRADQFCWHMTQVARYLDQRRRSKLLENFCVPWMRVIVERYPRLTDRVKSWLPDAALLP
jgi:hypothetical protein